MVVETVIGVGVIISSTLNVALSAFRPNNYSTGRLARRLKVGITVTWAIFLPLGGILLLLIGDTGGIVTGAVALAAWPVIMLALIKLRSSPAQEDADRLPDEQLANFLDEQGRAEIDSLLAAGKRIPAIRRVRQLTSLRLVDAQRLVAFLQR